jgi:hypothetical protein
VLAALEFSHYVVMLALVVILFGAVRAVLIMRQPSEWYRVRRLEQKVDLLLKHLGIEYREFMADLLSERVRALADDPAQKIAAIRLHREETGCGLREAKEAIEAYIAGRSG